MDAEFYAVHEFLRYADMIGIEVPGDSPQWRINLGENEVVGHSIGLADWPPPFALETLAIAQHHGVPTRLLDFTYDARVAAFFAAEDAFKNGRVSRQPAAQHFAIWAVDLAFIKVAYPRTTYRLRRVEVPRSRNSFLHAQHGFFLYDSNPSQEPEPSLEDAITEVGQRLSCSQAQLHCLPAVIKLECPVSSAADLLSVLASEFIDRSHLKPTLGEAVRALEEIRETFNRNELGPGM